VIIDEENADPALFPDGFVHPAVSVPRSVRPMPRREENRRRICSATALSH
jgi:hypothetical protein